MENSFKDQVARIDRLMTILEADDSHALVSGLDNIDVIVFTCQSMWHLKDWILKDPHFRARDQKGLIRDIHESSSLRVCADLANRSKHLSLENPKTNAELSDLTGVHFEPAKGIFRVMYYVVCNDPSEEYHGMEIWDLLRSCRDEWQTIIDRHYLSRVYDDWAALVNDPPTLMGEGD